MHFSSVSKKVSIRDIIDDKRRSKSPDTVDGDEPVNAEAALQELRKKFVGEIDLPESS